MGIGSTPDDANLAKRLNEAVGVFWRTRALQAQRQKDSGRSDRGSRGAVTGGAQMDGFVEIISDLIVESGVSPANVFRKKQLELPGFFRPTKEWDLLVIKDAELIAVVEVKSQTGPSFGNNFNNRTEEALGSALDLWTAYREGAFNKGRSPWLGYVFLLEDCDKSRQPVRVKEPHFEVFPEFKGASYCKRYEIFCRKLVRERHYQAAAFLTTEKTAGQEVGWKEPASDLTFENFARSLVAHASAF